MDKRRIYIRVTDTDSGEIKFDYVLNINLRYECNKRLLCAQLDRFIGQLRDDDSNFELSFSCFRNEYRDGEIPF